MRYVQVTTNTEKTNNNSQIGGFLQQASMSASMLKNNFALSFLYVGLLSLFRLIRVLLVCCCLIVAFVFHWYVMNLLCCSLCNEKGVCVMMRGRSQ